MSQHDSLQNQIIARAMKDAAFRQRLMSNPKATVEQEFGVTLPANATLHIHEDSDTDLHLVLPRQVRQQAVELSDEQLESAVGGMPPREGGCQGPNSVCGGGCCTCGRSTAQTLYTR